MRYKEIIRRAISPSAALTTAGRYKSPSSFPRPASEGIMKSTMEKLFLPELSHLVQQLTK